MRLWIQKLFNDTQAYSDFVTYLTEVEFILNKAMQRSLLSGKTTEAIAAAAELRAHQRLKQKFEVETSEEQQQAQLNEGGRNL